MYFVDLLLLISSFLAPNRPPGNVSWKVDGSWVTVRWDHVKSMDNESAVLGYKVSDTQCHRTLQLSVCCVRLCWITCQRLYVIRIFAQIQSFESKARYHKVSFHTSEVRI